MVSILISIHPQWCEKIVSGKKTIEVRKSAPEEVPFKAYIYCTRAKKKWSLCDYEGAYQNSGGEIVYAQQHIIGEFICDKVDKYTAEFVNNDCYEDIRRVWIDDDGEEDFEIITSNDKDNPEDCELLKKSCLTYAELKKYIGENFHDKPFYGLQISDLKIYDKPKELSEFNRPCPDKFQYCLGCKYGSVILSPDEEEYALYHGGCYDTYDTVCHYVITRTPRSWCYVEELRK